MLGTPRVKLGGSARFVERRNSAWGLGGRGSGGKREHATALPPHLFKIVRAERTAPLRAKPTRARPWVRRAPRADRPRRRRVETSPRVSSACQAQALAGAAHAPHDT